MMIRRWPTSAAACLGLAATLLCASCSKSEQGAKPGESSDPGKTPGTAASDPGAARTTAAGGTLVINTNTSDPGPKAAFEQVIERFKAENPGIEVKFNVFDHESFKATVRNSLSSEAPDVITWYAGNRMKNFVDLKLLEDVSDLWEQNGLKDAMASSLSALTVGGKQYGIPYASYQWGFYYRKDIFDQHGIAVPETWDQFLSACKTLKAAGVAPIVIGTKAPWTTAGWFDYLDLRINGMDFHMQLMDGKVPYTDERVKKVFETWRTLIDGGYFTENHATYSWQEAQAFLYQGKGAMYLIGNFLIANLPADVHSKMAYFRFPVIDAAAGKYEDAPIDTLHIPARAKNKEAARKFLAFVARPDNQAAMSATMDQLPLHRDAAVEDNPFLQAGAGVIRTSDGLAQFYDRDTEPEMATIGMQGFQEFMIKPDRRDAILERLEKARQRIFKQ